MYHYHPFHSVIHQPPCRRLSPLAYMIPTREFPPISTKLFKKSAELSISLLTDARLLMDKISSSEEFSYQLMNAAQLSDTDTVKELVRSIGMQAQPSINYNPDGLSILLTKDFEHIDCCKIHLALRWQ
ncbi:hypothetical protein WAK64_12185 [Bacillus spongiae]|uniref:Uncharacterized protein n=1 Tax=Bacillus spongiae TaxID=2683610 RepID=A0ABU8HF84_9BACI